jgi:TRAP-type C4-dicarboxylate transport system permease small subunit
VTTAQAAPQGAGPAGRRLADWLATGAEVTVALMMLHIIADVFARSVLGVQFEGTLETVANWYMIGTVFLPLALIAARGEHLAAEIFTARLPARAQAVLATFAALLTFLLCAAVVWYAAGDAWNATARGDRVELTRSFLYIWPMKWLVVLGYGLTGAIAAAQGAASRGRALARSPEPQAR